MGVVTTRGSSDSLLGQVHRPEIEGYVTCTFLNVCSSMVREVTEGQTFTPGNCST